VCAVTGTGGGTPLLSSGFSSLVSKEQARLAGQQLKELPSDCSCPCLGESSWVFALSHAQSSAAGQKGCLGLEPALHRTTVTELCALLKVSPFFVAEHGSSSEKVHLHSLFTWLGWHWEHCVQDPPCKAGAARLYLAHGLWRHHLRELKALDAALEVPQVFL
jgi:hypothetical protein